MLIRLIHRDECDALGTITVAAYRELHGSQPLGPYEEELADVEARRLDSEVYVALDDEGVLMGGVTFVPGPERAMAEFSDRGACGIRMLAIHPASQGRGAGRALVATCIARARTTKRERVILHSAPAMTRAQAMYVTMGFARAPELDVFIHEGHATDGPALHLRAFVHPL